MTFLSIFLGGGLGAVGRYSIGLLLRPYISNIWPATLMANLIGCILFFIIVKIGLHNENLELSLKVGFCGALTTFSTFSYEIVSLIQKGAIKEALLVLALNLILGVGFGLLLTR